MLLLIGIALLVVWAFGYLLFHLGWFVQLALVFGVVAIIWHMVTRRQRS